MTQTTGRRGTVRRTAMALTLGLGLLAGLGSGRPAEALGDGKQILTGGNSGSGPSVRYTGPGLGNLYNADFPDTGLGEAAASVVMPGGTLSKLRVSIVTQGTATTGGVVLTVRVNGVATALTCSLPTVGGICKSTETAVIAAEDLVSIEIDSTLDTGFWTFSYSVVLD